MSGGLAYVLNENRRFHERCNPGMVDLEAVTDPEDEAELRELVQKHYQYTGSQIAEEVLLNWPRYLGRFVKVMPREYKRVLSQIQKRSYAFGD
jgi:glutamate synthase (ferredoxin)